MDWLFFYLLLQSASEEWFKEDKCAGIYWKGVLEKKVVVLKRLTVNLEKSFAIANFFSTFATRYGGKRGMEEGEIGGD